MATSIVLTGQVFGRLTVLEPTTQRSHGCVVWRCACTCGRETLVRTDSLKSGRTKSCGCGVEQGWGHVKHGLADTPEYVRWHNMWARCTNPRHINWADYGGRGITICSRWRSFTNFLADMGQRPSPAHTLERKNNALGYSPDNCVWATRQEQNRNTRRNHQATWNGETLCLSEWAERTGLKRATIDSRLRLGWSVERTLTTPMREK